MGQRKNLDVALGAFPLLTRLDPLCLGLQGLYQEM